MILSRPDPRNDSGQDILKEVKSVWAAASEALYNFLKLLYDVTGSWGWAIILLTIITRLVLHPLNKKQMEGMQKMQRLQPRLKVLQEKYANDKDTLGRETMALYKENNVNPAAGCLPLLLQLPVMILLFQVLRTTSFNNATFFSLSLEGTVLTQLAQAVGMTFTDPSQLGFFSVLSAVGQNLGGLSNVSLYLPNLLLVVFICVITWYQQKMSSQGNPQMATMNVFMPLLMAFISLSLPGGVSLYWGVSSLMGVAQQWQISHKVSREEKPALYKEKPKANG